MRTRTQKNAKSAQAPLRAAMAALAVAQLGVATFAADTTWTGPAAGTWNVAANWNNGAPTAGNNTFVDNGAAGNTTVTVTASATTGTLNISAGDTVVVNNAASLSLNGSGTSSLLNNAGEVIINGTTASRLRFINAASAFDAQITGGGTITLNGINSLIDGTAAVRVVSDNFIHGQGNIGAEVITFDNNGTIAADVNAGTLTLDPDGNSGTFSFMRNTGMMRATGGGILDLSGFNGGTFNNTGTIEAQDNSTVRYRLGASVTGGTLTSSGTGSHRINAGNDGFFTNITNTALMVAENNAALNINTAITNNGTMSVEAGASYTALRLNGHTTVSGTGVIQLNGQNANIDGAAGARLTLGAGQTLRGAGFVGREVITITNNGLIVADINGGTLNLDPDANSGTMSFLLNNSILRATNGGVLQLDGFNGGTHSNASGTIEAQNNSIVQLVNGATVVGGTLVTSGTGSIRTAPGHAGVFNGVTNTGLMIADNNSDLNINTFFTNNGTIRIEAVANQTLFNIQNDATLSGSGQLVLSGVNAGISGPDDRRMTNAAGHTIRGEGNIGFNTIWFDNKGLIAADVPAGTLTLTADGTAGTNAFLNSGTLRATNGATLAVNGSEGGFNNTGGLIEAQDGSTVRFLNFADVRGGTLSSSGSGSLRVQAGHDEGFTDVTNNGLLVGENGSSIGMASTLVNNGTIITDAGAAATGAYAYSDTLISGPGQIILSGANAYLAGANDRRITNAAGHTIRGQGYVGGTEPWVTNEGLILADVPGGTLALAADGTAGQNAFINSGTIRATNGGLINFGPSEGGFTSTGGTIEAQNGSTVRFFNASILGGTFVAFGTGEFRVPSGNAVALNDVSFAGNFVAETNSNIQTFGPFVNNGTILLNSSGTLSTYLNVRAPTLLSGTGTLIMSGTTAFVGGLNDQRLTNGPQHTIRGQGSVGGTEIWVTNNGTIRADVNGASITLGADGTAGANAFINDGTLLATNGATIQFGPSEGGFSGLGTVIADANSNVRAAGVSANQGRVIGDGTFTNQGGSNFIATHYRVANLIITGAATRVRAGGGTLGTSQVSNLSITGAGGGLDLADHDLAIDYTGVSPITTVRGWLTTGRNNGLWNGVGINSTAAAASTSPKTSLGYAEASEILGITGGMFSGVPVDGTAVLVKYTVSGDSNLSGGVNLDDFTALAANFGGPGVWFTGDFNYDGSVNLDDFTILAANFGKTLPTDAPRGAAVPEPLGMSGLIMTAFLVGVRRRR